MASSSSPSPSSPSKSRTLLSKLLRVSVLILLLATPCSAARLGMATTRASQIAVNSDLPRHPEGVTSFRHRGRVFNYFPKGSPVPPSGPSKRHNDVVDSEPEG
ncbi:uncharacterized protein J3R85_010980 [Psidium guajava]|nr:uncharacterized protein J3R85_010980 [Psidium guajava]